MLKPFKLKTSDDYRLMGAAIAVRDKIKDGTIGNEQFDMITFGSSRCKVGTEHSCGSVRCLGGWMAVELKTAPGHDPTNFLDLSDAVAGAAYELFYPSEEGQFSASANQGLRALNKFIKGNKKPWDGIKVKGA